MQHMPVPWELCTLVVLAKHYMSVLVVKMGLLAQCTLGSWEGCRFLVIGVVLEHCNLAVAGVGIVEAPLALVRCKMVWLALAGMMVEQALELVLVVHRSALGIVVVCRLAFLALGMWASLERHTLASWLVEELLAWADMTAYLQIGEVSRQAFWVVVRELCRWASLALGKFVLVLDTRVQLLQVLECEQREWGACCQIDRSAPEVHGEAKART